ncbi:MAG: ATP-binding protein [Flavobacterium sp.]|nr:ATP-binding protein [Flavobacterium sp.]
MSLTMFKNLTEHFCNLKGRQKVSHNRLPLGRIVKIDGITLNIEISPEEQLQNITIGWDFKDYLVSIHRYIYCFLPCKRKIISRIKAVYDKDLFTEKTLFDKRISKYILEADLIAIYDDFSKSIDTGINSFPIIGAEVFPLPNQIYAQMQKKTSRYRLEIGESFLNSEILIEADPDILLGKHLGVFGNTGTGKSCTVASLIQGLKKRLKIDKGHLGTKIFIFDPNNEYESAFKNCGFRVKKVEKSDLRIPYCLLSNSELIKLFDASQGVQAPTLIEALELKPKDFTQIPQKIDEVIKKHSGNQAFAQNQWTGWNATMVNRIRRLIENQEIMQCINTTKNTIEELLNNDDEIIVLDFDFDRYELDIISFLVCKFLYLYSSIQKATEKKSVLLVLEEAHRYINESEVNDYKLGNYYFERIAREGRKFGLSLIISSQRPSELSKSVISQCNSFIIHRITNKNDYEYLYRIVNSSNTELLKAIPGLEKQYAVVCGEAFKFPDIVKIRNASPIPDSNDPKVIDSWIKMSVSDIF